MVVRIILVFLFVSCQFLNAQNQIPYTMDDRERLLRLEEKQNSTNDKIASLEKQMNTRFDALDDKFESKFNILFTLIYFVLGGIMGLIGFVLWDRRSFLKPVKDETKELKEREQLLERILKDYAKEQPKLAEILKMYGIF